jgi:hypothetical protein
MNDKLQGPAQKPGFEWSTIVWVLLAWMAAAYLFQIIFAAPEPKTLSYTKFKEFVRQGRVVEITMKGNEISGRFQPAEGQGARADRDPEGGEDVDGSAGAGKGGAGEATTRRVWLRFSSRIRLWSRSWRPSFLSGVPSCLRSPGLFLPSCVVTSLCRIHV